MLLSLETFSPVIEVILPSSLCIPCFDHPSLPHIMSHHFIFDRVLLTACMMPKHSVTVVLQCESKTCESTVNYIMTLNSTLTAIKSMCPAFYIPGELGWVSWHCNWAVDWMTIRNEGSIPSRGVRDFPLPHNVQTGPGAHPSSYMMGTWGKAGGI